MPVKDSLSIIAAEVSECRACPRLVEWREQVAKEKRASFADWEYWGKGVPALGSSNAELIVVGLAPAAHGANRTGRMFTGDRSGDWLFRAMYRAGFANQALSRDLDDGLELDRALVTSPVKCAPPANKPTPTERDACTPFLDRELAVTNPKVFIALGGFAYQALTKYLGVRPRPKFGHGVELKVPAMSPRPAVTVLGSYHVSQQNTFTGRLSEEMLDSVFARAREIVDET